VSTDERFERRVGFDETHEFAEPPEKVWRALTTPELRERWLPREALASPEPVTAAPEQTVSYRMRESETGGTRLRIVHELTDSRLRTSRPANGNAAPLMRAA